APRAAPPRAKLMQPKREKSQTAKPSDQPTAVFRIICSRTVRSSGILERTISTSARRRPRSTVSSPNSPSSAIRLMSGSSPTPPKLRQSAQRRLAHPRTQTTRRWADAVAKSLTSFFLGRRNPEVGIDYAKGLQLGGRQNDQHGAPAAVIAQAPPSAEDALPVLPIVTLLDGW